MTFRYLYDEKSPYNTIDFMKRLIDYFPFRIHCIQSATEGSACSIAAKKQKVCIFITKIINYILFKIK